MGKVYELVVRFQNDIAMEEGNLPPSDPYLKFKNPSMVTAKQDLEVLEAGTQKYYIDKLYRYRYTRSCGSMRAFVGENSKSQRCLYTF